MAADWQQEGVNADAILSALCDEANLEPDGTGGVILKRRQPSAPVVKRNEPMAQHDDAFVEELSDLLGRMSASDSRTLRKFMETVGEQVSEVKKDASSDFLAQLRAYLQQELANLAAIPGDGNKTDPAYQQQFTPGPKTLTPALKALADRLVKGMVAQRVAGCLAVEQDDRGLTTNPMRDARELAASFDMKGEKLTKADPAARTSAVEVDQSSAEETFGWAAQRRRAQEEKDKRGA
jgi:hypothetical protein